MDRRLWEAPSPCRLVHMVAGSVTAATVLHLPRADPHPDLARLLQILVIHVDALDVNEIVAENQPKHLPQMETSTIIPT